MRQGALRALGSCFISYPRGRKDVHVNGRSLFGDARAVGGRVGCGGVSDRRIGGARRGGRAGGAVRRGLVGHSRGLRGESARGLRGRGGYQARNPGQQWRTRFDGRGVVTTPDAGGWSWGLELVSYGRGDQSFDLPQSRGRAGAVCAHADGNRVSYEWDGNLTEWYINDSRGLEHGYTLWQRPTDHRLETGATRN